MGKEFQCLHSFWCSVTQGPVRHYLGGSSGDLRPTTSLISYGPWRLPIRLNFCLLCLGHPCVLKYFCKMRKKEKRFYTKSMFCRKEKLSSIYINPPTIPNMIHAWHKKSNKQNVGERLKVQKDADGRYLVCVVSLCLWRAIHAFLIS